MQENVNVTSGMELIGTKPTPFTEQDLADFLSGKLPEGFVFTNQKVNGVLHGF
jgi:hypothetical protein